MEEIRSIQVSYFRKKYREENIGDSYLPKTHFVLLNLFFLLISSSLFLTPGSLTSLGWIVCAFFTSNIVEYLFHRFALHSKSRIFKNFYRMHAGEHHVFFQSGSMSIDKLSDLKAVFFPWQFNVIILMFTALISSIVYVLFGKDPALIFIGTTSLYVLVYEWLHMCHHLSKTSRLFKYFPYLLKLQKHHELHHNPKNMSKTNFNITFPISDILFNTYEKKKEG